MTYFFDLNGLRETSVFGNFNIFQNCTVCYSPQHRIEGVVAQRCNPLTLKSEQSGEVVSIPGSASGGT